MNIFQTYIGSAYASHPVRWIESPEATRVRSETTTITERPVEKVDPDHGKPRSASGDVLDLSTKAQQPASSPSDKKVLIDGDKLAGENASEKSELGAKSTEKLPSGEELTPEEQKKVDDLKARDREVRIHEMAHVLAGGQYVTSGPSYEYELGPDGVGYAVAGSVGIDTSPVPGDPEATIEKMQTVAAAAMAPAQPSGPDLKVAAAARQAAAKASAELAQARNAPPEESEEQTNTEQAGVFSVVKTADKAAGQSSAFGAEHSSIQSYAAGSSGTAPGSAYKAQSVMTLATPRFSAFA